MPDSSSPPAPQQSRLAVVSLIAGILSFFCLSLLASLPAVVCGHLARAEIRRSKERLGGRPMATAGLLLGYTNLLFSLTAAVFVIFLFIEGNQDLIPPAEEQAKAQQIFAQTQFAQGTIDAFEAALDYYHDDTRTYPSTQQGLDALLINPGIAGWNGPYLKTPQIPYDPWGQPYHYEFEPGADTNFRLWSEGPDGLDSTRDDIGWPEVEGD